MARNIAPVFTQLEDKDIRVLNAVERGMKSSEWVPESEIAGLARLPPEETEYRISRLEDRELITGETVQYRGYQLLFAGYDVLALNSFVKADQLTAMGAKVGEGKESVVYECKNDDTNLVVKLHREGYSSFREVDRHREYTADKHHVSWMYTARKAAEKEYDALVDLHPDVSVPKPVDHSRHAVLLERMDGIELRRADLDKPRVVFDTVVTELSKAWERGYVHADISEYNIFVSGSQIWIFDWPQSVETQHPHAEELLRRDLNNLVSYFSRTYPKTEFPAVEDVIETVRG
ncbi:serine/threonine-protein kinase RIO2 [Halorutilales archaeon Cl-col2-1]